QDGTPARALEFLVLTATRTGETLGATWDEVDMGAKLWTIPAGRMKAGKEHRVPLSDAALAVLNQMDALRQNGYLFHAPRDPPPPAGTVAVDAGGAIGPRGHHPARFPLDLP